MKHWKDPCLPEVVEYAELGDHYGYPSQGMWRSLWFLVTRYAELATIMGYPSQGNTYLPRPTQGTTTERRENYYAICMPNTSNANCEPGRPL
jgi:hypothetical protein